jgi:hypothetical protein
MQQREALAHLWSGPLDRNCRLLILAIVDEEIGYRVWKQNRQRLKKNDV